MVDPGQNLFYATLSKQSYKLNCIVVLSPPCTEKYIFLRSGQMVRFVFTR